MMSAGTIARIITGELAPARYVPSAAIFAGNQDHIGAKAASPDSGFDTQSDLLLAMLTFP